MKKRRKKEIIGKKEVAGHPVLARKTEKVARKFY